MKLTLPKSWFTRRSKWEQQCELVAEITKDINNIGSIYRTVGQAMYDEPRERLAHMIAHKIVSGEYHR